MYIRLHVWGDFACFTRPEMKAERVSYDVITPSAARGILEAIYWKPQIRWVIDKLHVLRPIRWMNIRRNEVGRKAATRGKGGAISVMKRGSGALELVVEAERQQRAALILRDVAYVIEAHFKMLDQVEGPKKHFAVFCRRARKGQCFHRPYLGCREFAADFALIEKGEALPTCELAPEDRNRDLGFVLFDMNYTPDKKGAVIDSHTGKRLNPQATFFRARLNDGVIDVATQAREARS